MAIDKDPSIYRDRGTIGSSDELDEYGVWVKSEPQVLRPETPVAGVAEPSLPDIEDLPDLDIELETESELSPDDLSVGTIEVETDSLDSEVVDFDLGTEPEAAPEAVDFEPTDSILPDFSDSDVFSVEDAPTSLSSESVFEDLGALETPAPPLTEEGFTELSMDDFLEGDSGAGEKSGLDISIEADQLPPLEEEPLNIDLDFHDIDAEPLSVETENVEFAPGDEGLTVGSIEEVSDFDDFLNGLSDSSEPTPPSVKVETMELDAVSDAGALLAGASTEAAPADLSEDLDEISVDLSLSEGVPESAELLPPLDEHFDDVGAVGVELQASETAAKETQRMDLSTELLMRIADELSSIKTEISSLKNELGALRAAPLPQEEPKVEGHEASHGFFDEEDDEKIALTGDELDNILNTADFTEEAGADAGEDFESEGGAAEEFLSDQPDILGDESVAAVEPPAIEKIELEEVLGPETEPPEFSELREQGVRPMTEAPEDTTYLEAEETLGTEGSRETEIVPEQDLAESIDLTEAVIEEPDLGTFTLEEPAIEEPSIESMDIDLNLEEESLHVEEIDLPPLEEPEAEEFVLDELPEESFEEVIPEGFVVGSDTDIETLATEEVTEEVTEEIEEFSPEEPEISLPSEEEVRSPAVEAAAQETPVPAPLRGEIKAVLAYMDQLLESLPESKIEEFAKSEYFDTYKKLFEELGLA